MDINGKEYCSRCMRPKEGDGKCPFCGYLPEGRQEKHLLEPGTLLNGRYQLGICIGQGGSGITYSAWDETLHMPVAVKEYYPQPIAFRDVEESDEVHPRAVPGEWTLQRAEDVYLDGLACFTRESRVLSSLQSIPCVVKVLDFFNENHTAYIIMEFVHGQPVSTWARETGASPETILQVFRPLVDALVRTHSQGFLHRDITPGNLLMTQEGQLKLVDFGSAIGLGQAQGFVVITRSYAPVEQYDPAGTAQGPWTDVYSLGAVLYELLTGECPPESTKRQKKDTLQDLRSFHLGLKGYQRKAIQEALVLEPEKRIQSMDAFRSLLYHLPDPQEVRRRKAFFRKALSLSACLGILVALLMINVFLGFPLGEGLLYSFTGRGVRIVGEWRQRKERILPQRLWGLPVTGIRADAFRGDEVLESLTIPGSIAWVEDAAFFGCKALKTLVVGEGTEGLGLSAFGQCPSLLTITLPGSLSSLGEGAFSGLSQEASFLLKEGSPAHDWALETGSGFVLEDGFCYELVQGEARITAVADVPGVVTLPSYLEGCPVTSIAQGVHLTSPEKVVLPRELVEVPALLFCRYAPYSSRAEDWNGHVLSLDMLTQTERLRFVSQMERPAYVTADNENLREVVLGEKVERIGDMAFYRCVNLEGLVLPQSLRAIGDAAFAGSGLAGVQLPPSLGQLGREAFLGSCLTKVILPEGITEVFEEAFSQIPQLTEAELPESLQVIGEGAFAGTGLSALRIPEGVRRIGAKAFQGTGLSFLYLPESLQELGEEVFSSCKNLKCLYFATKAPLTYQDTFRGVGRGLTLCGVEGSAAEDFARLAGVRYSDTATWTNPDLLEGCFAGWRRETVPPLVVVPLVNVEEQCLITDTAIMSALQEENLLQPSQEGCGLEAITLSPFQTRIREKAFLNCGQLREVHTQGAILSVGASAFRECGRLTVFPFEKLQELEELAFCGCDSLVEVDLPDSLSSLALSAFSSCEGLRRLSLPRNEELTALGLRQWGNTSLEELYVPGTVREFSLDAFYEIERLVLEEGVQSLVCSFLLGDGSFGGGLFRTGREGRDGSHAIRELVIPSTLQRFEKAYGSFSFPSSLEDIWVYSKDALWNLKIAPGSGGGRPTIHGLKGSTAEVFARKAGLPFLELAE